MAADKKSLRAHLRPTTGEICARLRMAATATFLLLATCGIFLPHVQGEAITCWSGIKTSMTFDPSFSEEWAALINIFLKYQRPLVKTRCYGTDEWRPACSLFDVNMTFSDPIDGELYTQRMKLHGCSLETRDDLKCESWDYLWNMRKYLLYNLPRGLTDWLPDTVIKPCVCDSAKCNESPETMTCCHQTKESARQSKALGEL
ncbi:uncharacterized protein [Diadema setosum]|uniref:uncharacterized protein n=1 Tax=Diadema setosum TaxID=31175 RepID=UPI003B3A6B28